MNTPKIIRTFSCVAVALMSVNAAATPVLGCHLIGASAAYTVACSDTTNVSGLGVNSANRFADDNSAIFGGGSAFTLGQVQASLSSDYYNVGERFEIDDLATATRMSSGAALSGQELNRMIDSSNAGSESSQRFSQTNRLTASLIAGPNMQAQVGEQIDVESTLRNANIGGIKDYSRLTGGTSNATDLGGYGSLVQSNPDKIGIDLIIKGSAPGADGAPGVPGTSGASGDTDFGDVTADVDTPTVGTGGGLPGLSSDDQTSPFLSTQVSEPRILLLFVVGLLLMVQTRRKRANATI